MTIWANGAVEHCATDSDLKICVSKLHKLNTASWVAEWVIITNDKV